MVGFAPAVSSVEAPPDQPRSKNLRPRRKGGAVAKLNRQHAAVPTTDPHGRIRTIRGPVIDVTFPYGAMPALHEALRIVDGRRELILEVQQLLERKTVRTIALGHTDGLARGMAVVRTGTGMQAPVGPATIGRVFNMLGEPLDGKPPPLAIERRPIHRHVRPLVVPRKPLTVVETGIKIIDLLAPVARAGTTGIIGGAGVGKTILLQELMRALSRRSDTIVVFAGIGERTREASDLLQEMRASRTLANSILVLGQMGDPPGTRFRAALTALTMAEYLRDVAHDDVTFVIDSISRYLQAGCEMSGLMGRLPSEMGYQPTLAHDLGVLEERIAAPAWLGMTSLQAIYIPADDITDPAVVQSFVHLDTSVLLSRGRAAHGLYPAVDPVASSSRLLDPAYLGERHYNVAMRVKETIERYRQVEDIVTMLGMEELRPEDRQVVCRARRLERFLSQPLFVTEGITGRSGRHVAREDTLAGCEAILAGRFDAVAEHRLLLIGAITEAAV